MARGVAEHLLQERARCRPRARRDRRRRRGRGARARPARRGRARVRRGRAGAGRWGRGAAGATGSSSSNDTVSASVRCGKAAKTSPPARAPAARSGRAACGGQRARRRGRGRTTQWRDRAELIENDHGGSSPTGARIALERAQVESFSPPTRRPVRGPRPPATTPRRRGPRHAGHRDRDETHHELPRWAHGGPRRGQRGSRRARDRRRARGGPRDVVGVGPGRQRAPRPRPRAG